VQIKQPFFGIQVIMENNFRFYQAMKMKFLVVLLITKEILLLQDLKIILVKYG